MAPKIDENDWISTGKETLVSITVFVGSRKKENYIKKNETKPRLKDLASMDLQLGLFCGADTT